MAELVAYGVVLGSIITLGAVGLTLIYGIINFANFAHGDYMTIGAYISFILVTGVLPSIGIEDTPIGSLSFGWVVLLSFIPAMILTGLIAIIIDRLVYKQLRDNNVKPVIIAIASLGIAFFLRGAILFVFGGDFHFYSQGIRESIDLPLDIRLRPDQIVIFFLSIGMVIALYAFLQNTKTGKALRAMADNPDLARVTGIATERMILLTWIIGGGMAAAAGIMLGIDSQLRPEMGWLLLLPLFAAVIMGGIGNAYGALVGGLTIGIVQQVSVQWFDATYKPAVAFMVMILILLVRPQGIFGGN